MMYGGAEVGEVRIRPCGVPWKLKLDGGGGGWGGGSGTGGNRRHDNQFEAESET